MTEAEIEAVVQRVVAELNGPVGPSQHAVTLGMFSVAPGMTILADHMNSALQTGVAKFASAAARDAQWPAPPVGAMCYLTDVNYLMVYDNQITGGANYWHLAGGVRMGYARMGGPGGTQSIPNGNAETIVKLDVAGGTSNRPGRGVWAADGTVTVPVAGTYLATGSVCWPANTTGERRLYIKRYRASDSTWTFESVSGGSDEINTGAVGSTFLRQTVTSMIYMAANEKMALMVQHSASTALALVSGADQAKFSVHMLGAD